MRPVVFERNEGQGPAGRPFIVRQDGMTIAFGPSAATVALGDAVMSLRFDRAHAVSPREGEPAPGRISYFVGADPRQWRTDIPTYESIRYEQLYDGIDAVFYAASGGLEYDLIVTPRADPRDVRLRIDGATSALDFDGNLLLSADAHTITQHKPVAYQTRHGVRSPVDVRYRLEDQVVRLDVGAYDPDETLVIDPVIAYSTQFGGSGHDAVLAAAVDGGGNLYVAGHTFSTNFPTTSTSYHHPGGSTNTDIFIAKITPDGQRLLYGAIIGGAGAEVADAIAVDASGAAYVVGGTTSADFPTTAESFKPTCNFGSIMPGSGCGFSEGYALKLAPNGGALIYSTFFGGNSQEDVRGLTVDGAGEAIVSGGTFSQDFPVTPGAYSQHRNGNESDAFLTKFSADGARLVFSTFFGGTGSETANDVALDGSDNIWITGNTGSSDMPVLGAFQPSRRGGIDGFVAKFTPAGALAYATYFGGTGSDDPTAIVVASTGVFLAGDTLSGTLPGATRPPNFSLAAFVTQIAGDGSHVLATRFLDGTEHDGATGLAVNGNLVHVGGFTASKNFPVTSEALQTTLTTSQNGTTDAFYATFPIVSGVMRASNYATYFGGPSNNSATGLAADRAGGVYLFGFSGKRDMPLVNARWRGAGASEGFIAHIVPNAVFTSADARDIVLYANDAALHGDYARVADPSAAAGHRVWDPNDGAAAITAPSAAPTDYFELKFNAPAGISFRLWMRGLAEGNSTSNDSVWAQFSDSVDANGNAIWRIGSASGIALSLEECDGCGVAGWGWHDDGSGIGVHGPVVRFATSGTHTLRIQVREDGLAIDQLILSSRLWLSARPGAPKNSTNVYPKTVF